MNGKLIEKVNLQAHHKFEIKQINNHAKMGIVLTQSSDAISIWSVHGSTTLNKTRSFFAKEGPGCSF